MPGKRGFNKHAMDVQLYKSKAGFFRVFERTNDYGIYNTSGMLVATVPGKNARTLDMASMAADAFEVRYQY